MALRNLRIWAMESTLANPCEDARFDPKLKYPDGSTRGQGGWDFGIRFKNLRR